MAYEQMCEQMRAPGSCCLRCGRRAKGSCCDATRYFHEDKGKHAPVCKKGHVRTEVDVQYVHD